MLPPFTRSELKPFKPILQPWPSRKPCNNTCSDQAQSPFFSKLPPELRNLVYEWVFATDFPEYEAFPDLSPHPLSFLTTCHKVSHEATYLAFRHYTFPMDRKPDNGVYICFQNRIKHLTTQQLSAISRISASKHSGYHNSFPSLFANAMMLLPNLQRVEIRIIRKPSVFHHMKEMPRPSHWLNQPQWDEGIEKYSPDWFKEEVVNEIMNSYAYKWQGRQEWELQWPQLEDHGYYDLLVNVDEHGNTTVDPFMSPGAVGKVRGVHLCDCGCDQILWSAVELVNTVTGRKVVIDSVIRRPPDVPMSLDLETQLRKNCGFNAIILRPGAERPPVREDPYRQAGAYDDVSGYAFDGDEEYWEAIRRRNWVLGSIAKHWWRGVISLGQKTIGEHLPGSKFYGQGDWARMNEMEQQNAAREGASTENDEPERRSMTAEGPPVLHQLAPAYIGNNCTAPESRD